MRTLALVVLSATVVALAGAGRAAAQEQQVALTSTIVENFVGAHQELEALASELEKRYGDRSEEEGDDPVTALPAYQGIADARERTTRILDAHGFKDLDEWQRVTTSVLVAYDYVDPGSAPTDPAAEREKARADVEADTSLTPEQKESALKDLDAQYAALPETAPLPGNVDVVRPFADRIRPIAENNSGGKP
jgi:hypothetical protein